ncbi:MAG: transaldolase, partial [Armatimonadia bacterium]|nr:transaldolase [Armatimonadia bacterium]
SQPLELRTQARPAVTALADTGTELWLDTGDRQEAAANWGPELEALTTNNTLVNKVIQRGDLDEPLAEAAKRLKQNAEGVSDDDLVYELGFVANARIALDLVKTFDAMVSVELHPAFAQDVETTVEWGRRYFELCPSNFYIKVPMTAAGFLAVRKLSREGIPVNFTLGFAARQNYLAARLSSPSYVNVFLGRLNAVVADNGHGSGDNVGERVCLASDATIKAVREEQGGKGTKQIAASMREGSQVLTLAGVDVFTMPPKVFDEFLASDATPADLNAYSVVDLEVQADIDLTSLWDVSAEFKTFAADAAARADDMKSGDDLRALASGVDEGRFLYDFSPDEAEEIRADGKIPVTKKWLGKVPLDDLMSRAALESFTVDQKALDDRLRGML